MIPDIAFIRMLTCFFLCQDRPRRDQLNAAQSGAIAMNLDHELDYLIPGKMLKRQ